MTSRRADWRRVAPATLVVAWGGNHFSPLLLLYRQLFGYSSVQVDFLFAAYIAGLIPGLLLGGAAADRLGRKRTLLAGVVLAIVGSTVLALGAHSVVALCVGRLISGVSVAAAMAVGTRWIRELSADVTVARGATRASLSLSLGFGLGALVSGVLAQWGPAPTLLPYAVQIALSLVSGAILLTAPDSPPAVAPSARSLRAELSIPAAVRPRFLRVVLPAAPWVFGSAALSFVVTPSLLRAQIGHEAIAFATLLAVFTLTTGVAVQPLVPWIDRVTRGKAVLVGLTASAAGIAILAIDATAQSLLLGGIAGLVLGLAFGICLVSGLVEVQRMAAAHGLGGITGTYYALTYIGFTFPLILASLETIAPSGALLLGMLVVVLGCAAIVAVGLRATRPGEGVPIAG